MIIGLQNSDVISISPDPFGVRRERTVVVIDGMKRPAADQTSDYNTVVCLTTDEKFMNHDWTVTIEKDMTENGERPLRDDSYLCPWSTFNIQLSDAEDQITRLSDEGMKLVALSLKRMTLNE